jgi:hypothetical protein
MNEYCSFEDLKGYRGIKTTETDDDDLLKGFCTSASRVWQQLCRGRLFYPQSATYYFDHPFEDVTRLRVREKDLLEVTTFTTNNTSTSVSASDYFLMCGGAYHLTPYDRIVMKSDGSQPNLLYSGTPQKANAITGIWGYHENWANAWVDSGDTVQDGGGINSTVTTITVSDADGADIYAIKPRFKEQQLLKIGSEYAYVTAKNILNNQLTVRRGVNGTTAASHDNATAIYVYAPMEDVFHQVRRLAKWFYEQKDNTSDIDRPIVTDAGVTLLPSALPKDVVEASIRYRR